RNQSELMAKSFADQPNVIVDWGMRYGQPSIASRMDALQKAGCERILVFPLYPQYAAATTATVNDKAFEALLKMRWQPALRTVPP
ncbi:ferrochelatase, partial [Ensifer sp. ENS04]